MLTPLSPNKPSGDTLARLARYGLNEDEVILISGLLASFHCQDTCGRRRRCLDYLCKAAASGDALAITLLTVPHHDRLMDMAALAYGQHLSGDPHLCRHATEDAERSPSRSAACAANPKAPPAKAP